MSSRFDAAIRAAVASGVPPLPLDAIRRRERALRVRHRHRRGALAVLVLVLSFAGLAAIAVDRPGGAAAHPPAPIASLHPLPTIT
jgi:hypothetical protein